LIPVVVHSYVNLTAEDGVKFSDLCAISGSDQDSESTGRHLKDLFGEVEWCHGSLGTLMPSAPADFWIMRSYDPKKLYHLPDTGLVRGAAPSQRTTEWVHLGDERVPIHRAYYAQEEPAVFAAYLLVYNGEPVGNPYLAQLASFPRQLVRGTSPMNLFFVSARGPHGNLEQMEQVGINWLLQSLERYRSLRKR
jgi:hypothetical protein